MPNRHGTHACSRLGGPSSAGSKINAQISVQINEIIRI